MPSGRHSSRTKLLARLQDGELALEDVCELPDDMEHAAVSGHLEEVRAALASCDPCEPAGASTQATAVCEVAAPVATEEVLQRLQNLHFKTGLLQEAVEDAKKHYQALNTVRQKTRSTRHRSATETPESLAEYEVFASFRRRAGPD